jgi:hypothetical protein
MARRAVAGVLAGLLAVPAAAGEAGGTLLELGTRIFDVGVEADRLRGHPENEGETRRFIPVFDSPWLFEMRKKDPALYNVVFHIQLLNDDVGFIFDYDIFDMGGYQYSTGIPERFLLEGYEARVNRTIESVMYVPKDAPRDSAIICAREHDRENRRWRDTFGICFVKAAYPPDPKILPAGSDLRRGTLRRGQPALRRHRPPDA